MTSLRQINLQEDTELDKRLFFFSTSMPYSFCTDAPCIYRYIYKYNIMCVVVFSTTRVG